VAGHADLVGARGVDLAGRGRVDLRPLSAFLSDTALTGTAEADVTLRGTLDAPLPRGTLAVRDATLRSRALPQALTSIEARAVLDGRAIRLEESHARLGGGDLAFSGEAHLAGTTVDGVRVVMTGRDVALAYPVGMRTRLDADLTLTGKAGAFLLAGSVKALRGLYDLDVAFEKSLTARVVEASDSPLLRTIALDVKVDTASPVLVRNNMAQLQATGRLAVRGDMQAPSPIGTLEIAQGGKVYVQGREFLIRTGRLTYRGTWDPDLAVTASSAKPVPDVDRETGRTRQQVDVTVSLSGTLEAPGLSLSSTSSYTERELINLLASGDSQDSRSASALGGQAAALLAGRLARGLRSFGFDEVTIRPELVARDGGAETGARFTFGKRLTPRVNLVYSASLQDAENRFLQLEVTPGRDLNLTVQRADDGTVSYGAGQRFRRGGPARPQPPEEERVRLTEVRIEGDRPLPEGALRSAIGTEPGDRRTIWDLQARAESLRRRLLDQGFLEAEVGSRLAGTVAVFDVRSGARYRWRVEGMTGPPSLDRDLRGALFEEDAVERGRVHLLEETARRGQPRATVAARTERDGDTRTLVFTVDAGPRGGPVRVQFPGATALGPSDLLAAGGGASRFLADSQAAAADVLAAYRRRQYLGARVERPVVVERPEGLVVTVAVHEGPRARIGEVRFPGVTVPEEPLRTAVGLRPGTVVDEAALAAATERLRAHYFEQGYAAVRLGASLVPREEALDVVFDVVEGPRRTVGDVVVRGLLRTRESLVRRQVRLRRGRPVDPRALVAVERRILDLGIFSRVAVTASDEDPSTITVSVEEGDRVVAGYDVRYDDDETGSRAQVDAERRNLLGVGLTVGARYGVGPDVRDVRGVLSLPSIPRVGRLSASAFRLDEDLPRGPLAEEDVPQNVRRQDGAQLDLARRVGRRWDVLLGYRFKQVRLLPLFPEPIKVSAFDLSLVRDSRDNALDARRGRFWSVSLEYAPRPLGSDLTFVKGFGQAFVMRPIGPSFTWAQGARLGLAHGFRGQRLISTERFRAGGGNTVRGFANDSLGPEDVLGGPAGGQAVVVVNEELRYHHPSGLGGAVFYDAGNVFASASELGLAWRHSAGAGLRWASPVGLLRLDAAVPFARREGEKRVRFVISLGQAF
jgi:outer membrane protein insertion porin family